MSAARPCHLLVLAATVACQDTDLDPPLSFYYEGTDFDVWASDGLEACNGTFPYMEAWLSAFRNRVGQPSSSARPTFYWLSPDDFDASPCVNAVACAFPRSNVIYSSIVPAEHELVHTELEGWPPSLIREGAAEVFGSMDHFNLVNESSIESLADERQILRPDYQAAGRFSRFIIDRLGLDAYLDLYVGLDGVEGRSGIDAGVADVLGVELSSLMADFDQQRACNLDRWRFYDVECSVVPVTPWRGPDHWSTTVDLACDAPDVIGSRNGIVWVRRALYIAESDRYVMSIESGDSSAVATIHPCGASFGALDPTAPTVPMLPATVDHTPAFVLDAGRYWLQVEQAADTGAPVTVRIER